jgi:protein-histidine N-methyltransferase
MAEDEAANDETLNDIEDSDIRTGVYEGGFKTWECSVDLASILLDRGPRKDIDELFKCDQIVEVCLTISPNTFSSAKLTTTIQLGCGTALPTLTLFNHCLTNSIPQSFTLQDYNSSVLRLATLPNLLLTWATTTSPPLISPPTETSQTSGDIELTPEILSAFRAALTENQITLKFLSGSWSAELAALIPSSAPDMGTLVLGAETIYSPAATDAFVEILMILLRRVKMAKAMVAAKKFYFGVGGSVDGLKEACATKGAVAYEIENHGVPGLEAGVGRSLIEVQMY